MGLDEDQGRKAKGLHQVFSTGVDQGGEASGWGLHQGPRGAESEATAGVQRSWPECVSLPRFKHDGVLLPEFFISLPGKELVGIRGSWGGGGLLNHRYFTVSVTKGRMRQGMRSTSSEHLSGF